MQNSNSTDHSTPITMIHETEIKSTGSQSAIIVHNQVDASKLNKKSSYAPVNPALLLVDKG